MPRTAKPQDAQRKAVKHTAGANLQEVTPNRIQFSDDTSTPQRAMINKSPGLERTGFLGGEAHRTQGAA